jgi:Domain of unknown function (DUF4365)
MQMTEEIVSPRGKLRGAKSTLVERAGVTAAQDAFGKMGWFFREQPLIDYGIDAQVEIVEHDQPNGRLIALQIKSGASYFGRKRSSGYTFSGDNKHLQYWLRHCLPVFLILHNPEGGILLWQRVERHLVRESIKTWAIDVPAENVLDARAADCISRGISTDRNSQLRFAFSASLEFMRRIESGKEIYLVIDIWPNKSLGFRGAEVFFDTYEKASPDLVVQTCAPMHDPERIANAIFPWAGFEYAEPVFNSTGEVESHVLRLELNEYAKNFLALERFYAGLLKAPAFPDPPEDEDAERSASDFYCPEPDD